MSVRVEMRGMDQFLKRLKYAERNITANSLMAAMRVYARMLVNKAREILGKAGPFPDMDQLWRAIGIKNFRSSGRQFTGLKVLVRKDSKFDGEKFSISGLAQLVARGNYKSPGRSGKGDVTQYAIGDFIRQAWEGIKGQAQRGMADEMKKQVTKRLNKK